MPTPDNIWYCKTLLLFDMEAETDIGPKTYRCAYVSLLEQLKPRQPDPYFDLRKSGSRAIYEHDPNVRYEHTCAMFKLCVMHIVCNRGYTAYCEYFAY